MVLCLSLNLILWSCAPVRWDDSSVMKMKNGLIVSLHALIVSADHVAAQCINHADTGAHCSVRSLIWFSAVVAHPAQGFLALCPLTWLLLN